MATALPAMSSTEPPTSPLPAIPLSKPRKSLPVAKTPTQTPIKLKIPQAAGRPSALPSPFTAGSSPVIPTLRSASSASKTIPVPEKTVRKTISIASFPQPPNVGSRPATSSSSASISSLKPRSSDVSGGLSPHPTLRKKPSRLSTSTVGSYRMSQTPSLLNSSGEGKSVSSARISEGQISIPSPPQSRSSSAQGSYSTSATTFEDTEDASREAEASASDQRHGKSKTVNKGNVIVSVRVRPDAAGQDAGKAEGEWMVDGRRSLVAYRGREGGDYYYDNVFVAHDQNAKVYDASAKRLVRRVMEGYHGTVFAYGMTGTGKTFSMQGTATNPGVIPLAITDIFSYIRETPHREFLLRVSYLEIYNEKIHDLLSPPATGGLGAQQPEEIKLREDSKRGVYATPLKEEIVQSPTQLLRVIARGDHARRTGSTQFNARSSRSHAVVQIVVESRERAATNGSRENKHKAMLPGGVRVSTLSLIDLAGSERAAETKERRTEGAHINKSLLTLGTVIARLSGDKDKNGNPTDKEGKHLPYRDSKLTRLLQPALSGNSLVSILCTIQLGSQGSAAAANSHTGETLNTLKFAARAKNNIVSHAKKAEEAIGTGANAGLLERYRSEIQSLRSQLEGQQKAAVEKEERQLEKEAEQRHEEQMLEMQLARTALKERIEHLNRLILCSKSTGVNTSGTVSALGMHSRLSGGTIGESRSIRSSASQSTLGANTRVPSMTSLGTGPSPVTLAVDEELEEEPTGEYGDGVASLQAQNRALQSDLQDKNRYISTLEKRLLQARRTSHSRMSMGFSAHKGHIAMGEDAEISNLLQEKDTVITDLRARLEDKERMLTALRSAARKRDIAELSPESSSAEFKKGPLGHHSSHDSNSSSVLSGNSHAQGISPIELLSPQKKTEKKKRNVDEVSKMLDEMIQDKVESGHLIKGRGGSVRIAGEPRRTSSSGAAVPALGSMVSSLRESIVEEVRPAEI